MSTPVNEPPATPASASAGEGILSGALPRFILRQPLLDGEFRILGHELSVNERAPLPVLPGATSADRNRDDLLLASVLDLDSTLERKLTLLNLSPEGLDNPLLDGLPRERTVLAIRPVAHDDSLPARAGELTRRGFTLALDEAALSPAWAPLARQCQYLRMDVGDHDLAALADRLVRVEGIRGPRLIARNVETEEAYAACRKLSFQLYQGYYFTRSRPAAGGRIDAGRLAIMDLLNLVLQRAELAVIEARLKADAALAYRLLRYINSPAVGLRYPVRSIGHALLMLGHDQLYRWLTLLLFTHGGQDRRGEALLRNALVRARMAESLGDGALGPELRGGLFIAGILSMLDSLLQLPMDRALDGLHLAPPIVEALLRDGGPYAPWLALAKACEGGDPVRPARLTEILGLTPETVNRAHLQALAWAEGMDL